MTIKLNLDLTPPLRVITHYIAGGPSPNDKEPQPFGKLLLQEYWTTAFPWAQEADDNA